MVFSITSRDRYRGTATSRKKLRYITELVRNDGLWCNLRTIVQLLEPNKTALRALEADNVFVSAVYRWFRWLRYHPAYGITSPDEEARHCELVESHDSAEEQEPGGQAQGGIELLGSTAEQVTSATTIDEPPAADETPISVGEHEKMTAFQLDELQACFRKQNKLHGFCVHTNAMGIAFMLDPSMVLDAFVGADDGTVDDQLCKMAKRCGILTPTTGIPKLTAEMLAFKSEKRRGGEEQSNKYSESSPHEYWSAKSNQKYPLLRRLPKLYSQSPLHQPRARERGASSTTFLQAKE
ncbi:hypothetical protein F442_16007 [Phytophthora nicotianae P10297]|uniref:Uncharacterized protein n=1 Tax=Phytophthora nicotianae P10297 TaxID=1317064 RepID=W2YLX9_PHYNI|nr:hypothetical protein F442_16007 [Phytophthora nicotianae P10297]